MPSTPSGKYAKQRKKVTPPYVSLQGLRNAVGWTIDDLLERIREHTGRAYTRGAISAVENGIRGASSDLIEDMALAYGIRVEAFDTEYIPRSQRTPRRAA